MEIQIDQIALYVGDRNKRMEELDEVMQTEDWVTDEVKSNGHNGISTFDFNYNLGFNYEILEGGIEFEIIQKTEGTSYHDNLKPPCISHFGVHVEDLEEAEQYFINKGYPKMQYNKTLEHTGTDRKYEYTFMDTRSLLGYPLKLIHRVK